MASDLVLVLPEPGGAAAYPVAVAGAGDKARGKRCVMIGTAFATRGGIASVVGVYRASGFLDRHAIVYLETHSDGGRAAKLRALAGAIAAFWRILLTDGIQLLHVHLSSRASFWRKLLFLLPAYAFGVPTILHLHGSEFAVFYERECGPIRRRLVRFAFDRAAAVIALSQTWQRWLGGISTNPNIQVIYNPVSVPPPTAWAARSSDILFLGRIGVRKGSYDLIDAFSRARRADPGARLRMGGDGDAAKAGRIADTLGIGGRVDLLGWTSGDDRSRHLATAGLYALPSYHEGLPMSILEAMAAGLPVLSCPVGGIGEAIDDGVEGFLVPPGDIPALEQRLRLLLTDRPLAERMGAAARARVERQFSVETLMPRLDALYASLGA